MTTKEAAILSFFGSFGIPAYPSTAVPEDAEMPYITYDLAVSAWEGGEVNIPLSVWYRTDSEAEPNAKAREIAKALYPEGKTAKCDEGVIYFKPGQPFSQAVQDEDDTVKRRLINVDAEFFTSY